MHWLNKSSFLINSPWVPTAVLLQQRSKAEGLCRDGECRPIQGSCPLNLSLWISRPVWNDSSCWKDKHILPKGQYDLQGVMKVLRVWKREGSWEISVVLTEGRGRLEGWWNEYIYGTEEQRAHPLSRLVSQERHQWEVRLLQSGEGKGKSNAISQGLLRLFIMFLVGHCPVAYAWLRTAGRTILIMSTVMVTICHWHPPYLLCSL